MTASARGPAVRLREAQFQDYAAIAALEEAGGLKSRSRENWQRLWQANPTYRQLGGGWPIGWVLETSGGHIAGALGNVPLTYEFGGRKLLVAAGRAWTVEEAYRSYALLLMDRYFDQPRVDVFLNTTVNAKAAEAFGVFGSRPVPAGDWGMAAFLITRHAGFVESALRIKGLPLPKILGYPLGLALWARDRTRSAPHSALGIEIEVVKGFDRRFDEFWEQLRAAGSTFLGVRDSETLNWHFGGDGERLWVLTASLAGALRAYAVFQRKDEARYGLKRLRLVDYQALDSQRDWGTAILDRAVAECRARGVHSLEQVGTGLEKTSWFDRRAPYRRKLPHWSSYYFVRDAGLADQLSRPEAWAPSSFDGDASL